MKERLTGEIGKALEERRIGKEQELRKVTLGKVQASTQSHRGVLENKLYLQVGSYSRQRS